MTLPMMVSLRLVSLILLLFQTLRKYLSNPEPHVVHMLQHSHHYCTWKGTLLYHGQSFILYSQGLVLLEFISASAVVYNFQVLCTTIPLYNQEILCQEGDLYPMLSQEYNMC